MKKLLYILLLIPYIAFSQTYVGEERYYGADQHINSGVNLYIGDSAISESYSGTIVNDVYVTSITDTLAEDISTNTSQIAINTDSIAILAATSIQQNLDSLTFSPNIINVGFQAWTIKVDTINRTFTVYLGEGEISPQLFLENYVIGYNHSLDTLYNGTPIYSDSCDLYSFGQFKKGRADTLLLAESINGVVTHDIEPHTVGFATKNGNLTYPSHGFNIGSPIYVSDTSYGIIDYRPMSPNYNVRLGTVLNDSILQIDIAPFDRSDTEVNIEGFVNGIITEKQGCFIYLKYKNEIIIVLDMGYYFWKQRKKTLSRNKILFEKSR